MFPESQGFIAQLVTTHVSNIHVPIYPYDDGNDDQVLEKNAFSLRPQFDKVQEKINN